MKIVILHVLPSRITVTNYHHELPLRITVTNYNHVLLKQLLMALGAEVGFPVVLHVDGMLEGQGFVKARVCYIPCGALGHDVVT